MTRHRSGAPLAKEAGIIMSEAIALEEHRRALARLWLHD